MCFVFAIPKKSFCSQKEEDSYEKTKEQIPNPEVQVQ